MALCKHCSEYGCQISGNSVLLTLYSYWIYESHFHPSITDSKQWVLVFFICFMFSWLTEQLLHLTELIKGGRGSIPLLVLFLWLIQDLSHQTEINILAPDERFTQEVQATVAISSFYHLVFIYYGILYCVCWQLSSIIYAHR